MNQKHFSNALCNTMLFNKLLLNKMRNIYNLHTKIAEKNTFKIVKAIEILKINTTAVY